MSGSGDGVNEDLLPGFACDATALRLTYKVDWYHKRGEDFDLCAAQYDKLPTDEKAKYVLVDSREALLQVLHDARSAGAKRAGSLARLATALSVDYDLTATLRAGTQRSEGVSELTDIMIGDGISSHDGGDGMSEVESNFHEPWHDGVRVSAESVRCGKAPMLCLVVGDSGVGKSSLLWAWKHGRSVAAGDEIPPVMRAVVTNDARVISRGMKMMCVDTRGVDVDVSFDAGDDEAAERQPLMGGGSEAGANVDTSTGEAGGDWGIKDGDALPGAGQEVAEDALKRSMYGRCHCVWLVVDSTDIFSLQRARGYWLRELKHYKVQKHTPVFIVATRSDEQVEGKGRAGGSEDQAMRMRAEVGALLSAFVTEFPVTLWSLASSLDYPQVEGLAVRAQCSVVYPLSLVSRAPTAADWEAGFKVLEENSTPMDPQTGRRSKKKKNKGRKKGDAIAEAQRVVRLLGLRPKVLAAMSAIFESADMDNDGLLNNTELAALQQRCFDSVQDIHDIKQTVDEQYGVALVSLKGLSFPAYLLLCLSGVMQGRSDMLWRLLEGYGYTYDTRVW